MHTFTPPVWKLLAAMWAWFKSATLLQLYFWTPPLTFRFQFGGRVCEYVWRKLSAR